MNILIIGSGAREHAIAKALRRSPQNPSIFCFAAINNPGLMEVATGYCLGNPCDIETVVQAAKNWQIDMVIIGPEAPLEIGLADSLLWHAIPAIGPTRKLAQIESSKAFTRQLLKKYHIPGNPEHRSFEDLDGARDYLQYLGENNYVIKADGLSGGKGVKVAGDHLSSLNQAYQYCQELNAQGQGFTIEEKLLGQEFSMLCFSDGRSLVPMPAVQDHKRAFVGNLGPNTGGMGSYTDANHRLPFLTEADIKAALRINEWSIYALQEEMGEIYRGILYGGFMATRDGVRLIEFNARFGDPEAINLLAILNSDFVDVCQSILAGTLNPEKTQFAALATVCKYAVPEGYPNQSVLDAEVDLSQVQDKSSLHIASLQLKAGKLYTAGSRTAAVVGVAKTLAEAEKIAETEISRIQGRLFHREDIGKQELIQSCVQQMQELRQREIA